MKLTRKQIEAITRIQQYQLQERHSEEFRDRYEIKAFSVAEVTDALVSVYVVVGLKNDEGTYACLFARDRGHFFVGPRGGIKSVERGSKARRYPLVYGWR